MAATVELRQALISRTERLLGDVQRQLDSINTCDSETLDGLCFRGEQLARQIASLVTGNVVDSSVLSHVLFAYEKLILCSLQVEDEEMGYRAGVVCCGNHGGPSYQISREQLVFLLRERFTRKEIADVLCFPQHCNSQDS